MNSLAAATVGALSAVHAGFDGKKDPGVDGPFDLPGEVDEAVEVVVRPERVKLMMSGRFGLGEDVEPEERVYAMHLLLCITERCRLKITVSLAVQPLHRSRLPVAVRNPA